MDNAKSVDTPILANSGLNNVANKIKSFPFREAVESLFYPAAKTRPDLSYAVADKTIADISINNVKRTLRYLQGIKHLGIIYNNNNNVKTLKAFRDVDYAGDVENRKSTSGYIIEFCGGPISWASHKQPITALSSTEAEFISAADCCKELLFLKNLLEELINKTVRVEMHIGNQSAIKLIKTGIFN